MPVSTAQLAVQNFSVDFDSAIRELIFNWDKPRYFDDASSTLVYQIIDAGPSSSLPMIQASGYFAASSVSEVGRNYQFNIQAIDENGTFSLPVTKEVILSHLLVDPYVIASQLTASSSKEGSYNGEVSQKLGSGLSGKLGAVTFRAKFGRAPRSIRVNMYESDSADYGGVRLVEAAAYCGIDASSDCSGQKIENGVEKNYTIPAVKDYVFDPAKYYKFEIITYQVPDKPLFYGSDNDLYFIVSSRTPL